MHAYTFNDCQAHEASRELWRAGKAVDIQRLQFDLLLHFLRNPQRAISKDELLDAVWKTTDISESALARAVMKLRRAIGDDAERPSLIKTLHRVGYLFAGTVTRTESNRLGPAVEDDVEAAATASPPGMAAPLRQGADLAFLRLDNATGHETLNWARSGLPALLVHMCEQRGLSVAALALEGTVDQFGLDLPERVRRVGQALGVPRVVSMTLRGAADLLALDVALHDEAQGVSDLSIEAPDIAQLAIPVIEWLNRQVTARRGIEEESLPVSVLELLAKAEHEMEQSRFRVAGHLLLECVEHVPSSLRIQLALARARQQQGQIDLAADDAQRIALRAAQNGNARLQLQACLLESNLRTSQGRYDAAARILETARVLSIAFDDPDLDAQVAEADANLAMRQGQHERATQCLETALARLAGSSNQRRQVAVRLSLAMVLILRQLLSRATLVLARARRQLEQAPSPVLSADADQMDATMAYMRKQFSLAAQRFHAAQVVFEASGREAKAWRSLHLGLYARMATGALAEVHAQCLGYMRLDEAPQHQGQWRPQAQGPQVQMFLREVLAETEWRMGQPAALDRLLALQADMGAMPYFAAVMAERRSSLAIRLAGQRRLPDAHALLTLIDVAKHPLEHGAAHTAIVLAQGQVEAALQWLTTQVAHADLGSAMGSTLAINCCWLALELGRMQGVDSLIAHIDDYCDDFAPAAVVRARYFAAQGQVAQSQAELRRVLSQWPESPMPVVHDLLSGNDSDDARDRRRCMLAYDLGT